MKPRARGVLVGALAVCCLALGLAATVYPASLSEPHASNPADERFTVGATDSYHATGRVVVDGETKLAFEAVVTGDGARYHAVEEPGVRSEQYQAAPDAPVHERIAVEPDDAERLRAEITADDDRTLVRDTRTAERVTFVVEENATDRAAATLGSAKVVVRHLQRAEYAPTATGAGENATVHEPQAGWYAGRAPYRITDASGVVRTAGDSNTVTAANVTWDVTAPAGSYAEYVLASLIGDDPRTHHVSFEFDDEDAELDRPAWVNETGTQ